MEENIILIGMPGAGKSTVGVILAKALGMDFVDSDLAICKRAGTTLQTILDQRGLEAFLELEEQVVLELELERTVLATGGSVPMGRRAMDHLRAQGRIVYLDVGLEELHRRLSNITTRGIAFGPGEDLETLYRRRTPIYRRWADVTVRPGPQGSDLEQTVAQILRQLQPAGEAASC